MKNRVSLLLAALVLLAPLSAQTLAFTYQGRLTTTNGPAHGPHDMRFVMFSTPSGGNAIGGPLIHSAVTVVNGAFTVALDFGANAFSTGGERWLDIAVRPAGNGAFTQLLPRQPITPTPYAVTALNSLKVSGVDGHSLHAADGNPEDAVFVDDAGNVGVGTVTPETTVHVSKPSSRLRLESSRNDTWTTSEYRTDAREWHTGVGGSQVFNDLRSKYYIFDATAGLTRLAVDTTGQIGIGTTTPTAQLDVRGAIRLGPNAKLLATGGDEGLRILRGEISLEGNVLSGSGFTCNQTSTGIYHIVFNTSFADGNIVVVANVSVTSLDKTPVVAMYANANSSAVDILLRRGTDGELVSRLFTFMVIGQPR